MSWPRTQIKDVARVVGGGTPRTSVSEYWDGEIDWVTPKDLSDLPGKSISSTPRRISTAGLQQSAAELLPANSVLFSSRAPIGHVAINTVPMATNQGFKSLVPGPELDASFLYWWLDSHRAQLQALGNGATFKELSKAVVERIEIPLPSLVEQKRIAAILDQADALRRLRRRTLDRLSTLGQAIFQEMFGDARDIPHVKLEAVTSKIGSGMTPRGGEASYISAGVPLIRSMNVRDGFFSKQGLVFIDDEQASLMDGVQVAPGDVLLNITGASVARSCIAPEFQVFARVNQHVAIIRPTSELSAQFLCAYLCLPRTQSKLLNMAGAGATRQALTKSQISDLEIPLPHRTKQDEFAAMLSILGGSVQREEHALASLDALFASLQHRAFTGQL